VARKRNRDRKTTNAALPVMRPDAAGIDIGATEIFVAVPVDRAAENVRSFPTFTQDLYALADWLAECGVKTVAMESTGVYWIPLFQILEDRGLEVCLVNARHVKNVPGRRTDVSDCQWIGLCPAYRAAVVTALPAGSMYQLFSVTDSTFGRE
jgi:transposase